MPFAPYYQLIEIVLVPSDPEKLPYILRLFVVTSVTLFSAVLVSTSPIRKWLGVRAARFFGSEDIGVMGREFKMASISMRYVFIVSNVSN